MAFSRVFDRLTDAYNTREFNIYGLQGGTSSSKTFSSLQFLVIMAEADAVPTLTSVVSESIPHLKRGALRDFFKIIDGSEHDEAYNITNMVYTFPNGSKIEFFSADDPAKLRGARRDRLYLNEANNIEYSAYNQLQVRTKQFTICDWNPESKFWFHKSIMDSKGVWFDISTHWDNKFLDDTIRNGIEARKITNPEWYRVYGEGQIGQYEGLVFRNVKKTDLRDVFPTIDRIYYGLDFGYSPDPAAFLITGYHNGKVYIFKEIVANDLDNEQLAALVKPWSGQNVVWCDSAEPKSIVELKKYGVNARSVGRKDRQYEINWLKSKEIIIDSSCVTTIDEMEDFCRKKDRQGQFLPIFEDSMPDHCIDSLRYSLCVLMNNKAVGKSLHIGAL